jgi:hypothetical protein
LNNAIVTLISVPPDKELFKKVRSRLAGSGGL